MAVNAGVNAGAPLLEEGIVEPGEAEKTDGLLEPAEEKEVPLFDFMEYPAFQCVAAPFSCVFGVSD